MYVNERPNNGWVLCPSKSFPGKFYYFNVLTGETAWSLNEKERLLSKSSPLQRIDHGYPEPISPPIEDAATMSNHQQIIKFNPYHERTSHFPPERNLSNYQRNPNTLMIQSIDQNSIALPYQIQVPMIWSGGSNMPVIMLVMNQAMRQLSIDEPRQSLRVSNNASVPSRAYHPWKQPNQTWKGSNQSSKEPNQSWKEPNQLWKEPIQDSLDSNEPDRELFIQPGKVPIGQRFSNYNAQNSDLKYNGISQSNQYHFENQHNISTNKTFVPTFGQNQTIDSGSLKLHQNQQNSFFREPIFKITNEKTNISNQYLNFGKKSHEAIESNCNAVMPNTNQSVLNNNNYSNSCQNIYKPNEIQFKQIQINENLTKSETNKNLFWESQTKQNLYGQSQKPQNFFGQSQTRQELVRQNKVCPEVFQSSSLDLNPFQKIIKENSNPKHSTKVEFPKSPKPNLEIPSCSEELNFGTNVRKESILTHDNKTKISQEPDIQNLDKSDLRRTLMEKKRKSNILETIKSKKIKTYKQEQITMAKPKKKVTFNLSENFSGIENDCIGVSSQKELEYRDVLSLPKNVSWYVVTDTKSILMDFDFLNSFVKSDPKCTLIIPSGVMSKIVTLSRTECRETNLVTRARHVLRAVATPQTHINVQNSENVSQDVSAVVSILNCCLEVLDKAYVVLITNDENLQTQADYLNIRCLSSEQIKNCQANRQKVRFDVKKITTDREDNIQIPTEQFQNLTFGTENKTNQKWAGVNHPENKDLRANNVYGDNIDTFETQRSATKFNDTTFKNISESSNSIFKCETKPEEYQIYIPETEIGTYKKNEHLENFIKCFYEKHKVIENLAEERKQELECNFRQIMEECLNSILLQKTSTETVIKPPPPWSLVEALECMVKVYNKHTYVRDVVAVFTAISDAKRRTGRDLICIIGCGVALVQYLKFISPTTEILKDTEDALKNIFHIEHIDIDMNVEPIAPTLTLSELIYVEKKKSNYVKDRAEVLKYLKKHFAAWADYDETLESNFSWDKKYNEKNMIVRTYGKNLGMLKLSNSKTMTMEPDSCQNIYDNTNTIINGLEHAKQKDYDNNIPKTEHMGVDSKVSKRNYMNFKLTRTVNTTAAEMKNNFDSNKELDTNRESKKTEAGEPKVIRILNNFNVTVDNINKKLPEKQAFDDWSTHGHTFGITEQHGPKILKNIKPIKEFEEKFIMQRESLELEDIDQIVSKSDENNNNPSESTDNNCLSMSIDCLDVKNDRFYETNVTQTCKSNANSTTTNENCVAANATHGTIDLHEILSINHSGNKSNTDFDCDINALDYFKRLNCNSFHSDALNDMMTVKDDTMNDFPYENTSQQACHLMDTFLFELKVTFKALHMFIETCARRLGQGTLSPEASGSIQHLATTTRSNLTSILDNLGGIIQRESSSGPKLKTLVAGAGSMAADDERIDHYCDIVTKCYEHARLILNALNGIVSLTNKQELRGA